MEEKKIIQKVVLAGVVFDDDNKVLVLQRHKNESVYPGMWELPSGKRENLEPSEQTLLREIKEEAGIGVDIIMPISVFDYQIEKPEEIRDSTQINFLVKMKKDEAVKISSEHQNFAWLDEGETGKYNMSEETSRVVKKAFELLKIVTLK